MIDLKPSLLELGAKGAYQYFLNDSLDERKARAIELEKKIISARTEKTRDNYTKKLKFNCQQIDLIEELLARLNDVENVGSIADDRQEDSVLNKNFSVLHQRTAEAKQRLSDNKHLDPIRHPQVDFFVCDMVDYALKDDQASMEAPIFSLSTREDMKLWTWTSEDGKKSVEVAPGFYGRATQHDKDILIYCTSQLTEAINKGLQPSKTVRFTAYDFLVATNRTTGGVGYDRLKETLNRLSGMRITTNIITGKNRIAKGFGIVDSWEVIEKSPDSDRMIAVEVTLSDWLYNSIQTHEVLTIHPDYFRLRKPLERRLYEIARKHVGKQGAWKIALEALRDKCGSTREVRKFKADLKAVIEADTIPQYRYQLGAGDMITIYDRDPNKALKALI